MPEALRMSIAALVASTFTAQAALGSVPQGWAHSSHVVELSANRAPLSARNIADVLLIQKVMARWGIAYDEGRLDVIKSLFAPDALYEVLLGGPKPIVSARGRDKILTIVQSSLAQQGDQRRHAISNVIVEQHAHDRASAMAYGIVAVAGQEAHIGSTLIYSADLVKKDGVWVFTRFVIGMDAYAGTAPNIPQN